MANLLFDIPSFPSIALRSIERKAILSDDEFS
jgi:hypothetical protein